MADFDHNYYSLQTPQLPPHQQSPPQQGIPPLQQPEPHPPQFPQQPNIPQQQLQLYYPLQESTNEITTTITIKTSTYIPPLDDLTGPANSYQNPDSSYQQLLPSYNDIQQQNNFLIKDIKSKDAALKLLREKESSFNSQLNSYHQRYKAKEKQVAGKLYFLNKLLHKEAQDFNENSTAKQAKYTVLEKAWKVLQEVQSKFLNKKTQLEGIVESYKKKVKDLEEERQGTQTIHKFEVEQLQKRVNEAEAKANAVTTQLQSFSNEKNNLVSENQILKRGIISLYLEKQNLNAKLETMNIKTQSLTKEVSSLEREKEDLELGIQGLSKKIEPMANQVVAFVFDKEKLVQQGDKCRQENEKLKSSVNSLRGRCDEMIDTERKMRQEANQYQIRIETLEKKVRENLIEKREQSTQTYDAEAEDGMEIEIEDAPMELTTFDSLIQTINNVLDGEEVHGSETAASKENARKLVSQGDQPVSKRFRLEHSCCRFRRLD